jgi:hypothetical protein
MDDFETLRPLRKLNDESQEMAELVISGIYSNIAWLAERGLRPHSTMIECRAKYVLILNGWKVSI